VSPTIGVEDIKSFLGSGTKTLTQHDLYFRKQSMLMKNAVLPKTERAKIARKMNFQSHHSDLLSIPKSRNMSEKFASTLQAGHKIT